ncbi:hypothetical protein MHZ92_01045 [Sporosarcina sp. ACRSL]|uniref:hypothetical protein n=1 Tax=Sporosarcina sp. ACRSL TaxID=2918215 RepID=UPI001EF4DC50|nr:hypothetical protein [Sporosarcina sp. ACRSL]MCG7342695.1 hypothetical protein [Sporosarcina sp. ACRSL]
MGQSTYEKDRNRFNLSERLIVEMFLLSYVFIFFLGETGSLMPYVWILISISTGVLAFFLFYNRDYSLGYGAGLALVVTAPLLLFNAPLLNVLIFFVYVLWRIQANFNGSRIQGWPFLTVNTLVFVILFFLARLMFAFKHPEVLMKQQLILFLITTFLYFFVRMVSITVNSRVLNNFKVEEAGKIFGYIIGLGAFVFGVVFFTLDPVRRFVISVLGFVFGGALSLIGPTLDSIFKNIKSGAELREENMEEPESGFVDFELQDELTIYGNTSSIFEYTTLALVLATILIITIILIRRRGKERVVEKMDSYSFSFRGRRQKPEDEQRQLLYDYSSARDEVRKTFEEFEKEAQNYNFSRMHGETVQEWFSRMGWKQNELILSIYNDVRYGSRTPSEKEHSSFIEEIEQIKKTFFKKEV